MVESKSDVATCAGRPGTEICWQLFRPVTCSITVRAQQLQAAQV